MDRKYITKQYTDANGYVYEAVENDEHGVRVYTLANGLRVFLAQNFDAPRIQTYIPVRVGSNDDPKAHTGLAHYLEHMMFKGTSKIGSADWEKEKPLLEKLSELFEQHKAAETMEEKKQLYKSIDAVSQEAAVYAIANEYDKCVSSLGATGTNAHTWLDETVYKNTIPSNELKKWLQVEKERFSELVLRLFHTELESVYEEFNRAQDHDGRLVNYALMELLFPNHPNGQQTTLGKAEHLKNPSMKAIHRFFQDYYVPNNYALVLVGDLDFEETIRMVEDTFGGLPYRTIPERVRLEEAPMTKVVSRTVKSPTIWRVQLAWRTQSYGSREAMLADVVANLLSNRGEAGLLDLNVNQKQKLLYAQAFSVAFKQYGYFSSVMVPKEQQTFEEAMALFFEELERVKRGDFPDWLIPAIIDDFRLQRIKALETADGLASNLYDVFIKERTWAQELAELDDYATITKEEVMAFAQRFFGDNYAVVYKEQGENERLIRVENPGITPVKINREARSVFFEELLASESLPIEPRFIDYQKAIETSIVGGRKLSFVANKYNGIAQVHYLFPFGNDHDKTLSLATFVLQYLGTDVYTTQALKEAFYRLGITTDFKTSGDRLQISLSGLEERLGEGMALLHHWMSRAVPDQAVYDDYVQTILESRAAAKKDKGKIMSALISYAKYGAFSRTTDVLSNERLLSMRCSELTDKLRTLFEYPYELFFYGRDLEAFKEQVLPFVSAETRPSPEAQTYPEPETKGQVYFVDYDMVQVEMAKVGRAGVMEVSDFGKINVFNEYFGQGLSSIVFQEIRESKSLAYSAYVTYSANSLRGGSDYVTSYIGTQPDKLSVAVGALEELLGAMPEVPMQFENARETVLKQMASTRINRTNIFFNYLNLKKLGVDYDLRKSIYEEVGALTMEGLVDFYVQKVKPLEYNVAVIGKRANLDEASLSRLGAFRELKLEEIFGY
ncbi:M16 family metallopeptidase [Bergeyella sp. RCAD1439]|uniref:M16 family metallopeptidase n=1 Tax=Bergeyella anatis TaxID=3113737 RepID=UPI002E18E1E5|nr:insulinase family protein [Bergeyella sp. RCAD1439]